MSLSSTAIQLVAGMKPFAAATMAIWRVPSKNELSGTVSANTAFDWPDGMTTLAGTARLLESLYTSETNVLDVAMALNTTRPPLVNTPIPSTAEFGRIRAS